jgi:hypothetical protein
MDMWLSSITPRLLHDLVGMISEFPIAILISVDNLEWGEEINKTVFSSLILSLFIIIHDLISEILLLNEPTTSLMDLISKEQ